MITADANVAQPVQCYRAVVLSMAHLTVEDNQVLTIESNSDGCVSKRDCGYFIKLLETEPDDDWNLQHGHSDGIRTIIRWAYYKGYRLIEFSSDADPLPQFPTYDW